MSPRLVRLQVPPNSDLTLGMRCLDKSEPGHTVWEMTADERFANPAGIMQGGFVGAFCDSAMSTAAVTFVRGRKVVAANVEMKVSFLAPVAIGTVLTADAVVVAGGRRVAFTEVSVTGDDGRLLARASSTYLFTERSTDDGGGDDGG
jgi:uncharacterized protein (TIGR00369 family)